MYSHPPENADTLRELREKLRQGSRDSFQLLKNFGTTRFVLSGMMKPITASS